MWGSHPPVFPGSGDNPSAVPRPDCSFPGTETHGHEEGSRVEVPVWLGAAGCHIQGDAQGSVFAQPGEEEVERRLCCSFHLCNWKMWRLFRQNKRHWAQAGAQEIRTKYRKKISQSEGG